MSNVIPYQSDTDSYSGPLDIAHRNITLALEHALAAVAAHDHYTVSTYTANRATARAALKRLGAQKNSLSAITVDETESTGLKFTYHSQGKIDVWLSFDTIKDIYRQRGLTVNI